MVNIFGSFLKPSLNYQQIDSSKYSVDVEDPSGEYVSPFGGDDYIGPSYNQPLNELPMVYQNEYSNMQGSDIDGGLFIPPQGTGVDYYWGDADNGSYNPYVSNPSGTLIILVAIAGIGGLYLANRK